MVVHPPQAGVKLNVLCCSQLVEENVVLGAWLGLAWRRTQTEEQENP